MLIDVLKLCLNYIVSCLILCLHVTGIDVLQDYVPPAPQPPVWPEGGMVYPDMSQPPPVQMPAASGMTSTPKITLGEYEIAVVD
jgi:hypothetical protein